MQSKKIHISANSSAQLVPLAHGQSERGGQRLMACIQAICTKGRNEDSDTIQRASDAENPTFQAAAQGSLLQLTFSCKKGDCLMT